MAEVGEQPWPGTAANQLLLLRFAEPLKHLGQALLAGLVALGLADPAGVLLAIGVRQALERGACSVVSGERVSERLRHFDFARRRVELQFDVDRVPSFDARLLAHRPAQAHEKFAAHSRHRRPPAVAVDRREDGEALGAFADGGHLFVIEHHRGGGTARHERCLESESAHGWILARLGFLPYGFAGGTPLALSQLTTESIHCGNDRWAMNRCPVLGSINWVTSQPQCAL